MNNLTSSNTMSIKELSLMLNVSDKHIRYTIKKLFPELMVNGVKTNLSEAHATAIKLEIGKNPHLDQSVELKTNLEKELIIQQAMNFQQEKIQFLEQENIYQKQLIIEQTPKAEFYDHVAKSGKYLTLKTVSDILGIPEYGRNNLCKRLREEGYLTRFNQPYQKHKKQGLFKSIVSVSKGGHISTSTVVSQKGLIKIRMVLLNPKSRNTSEYRSWKHAVLYRDHFKCVNCGSKVNLEAHHKIPWSKSVTKRYDKNNGVTLCHDCHLLEHKAND